LRQPSFDARAVELLPALYDTAARLCRNPADAQDLTHDTFVRALAAADRFEEGSLKAWLLTILHNRFRTRARDSQRHPEVELDERELPAHPPLEHAPLEGVSSAQLDAAGAAAAREPPAPAQRRPAGLLRRRLRGDRQLPPRRRAGEPGDLSAQARRELAA
jgi:RNA polymerase sigma factor (sigma-70 family)